MVFLIYVGSLKYSPIYKSHCCAFGKACEAAGYHVKYLFSRDYDWMLPPEIKEKTIFVGTSHSILSMAKDTLSLKNIQLIKKAFITDKPTHVYMLNYHLLNHIISSECKKYGAKFLFHAHEPYVENKSAHGGLQHYWLYLSEYMEARLLKKSAIAVVSSDEGIRLFDKAFPWFKATKLKIPLLYEDLGANNGCQSKREYVTFVGPLVPAKGPEIFLNILDYSAQNNPGLRFLLISREKIVDPQFLSQKNLEIHDGGRISDEDYGALMQKSYVVLTPYKRETQSSVILVSYMHGTPVVSSNVGGLPEFVQTGETGYLLDIDAPAKDWVEKILMVQNNLQALSVNCRRVFVANNSSENWGKYLPALLT